MLNQDVLSEFAIFSEVNQEKLTEIAQGCEILEFELNDVILRAPGWRSGIDHYV